VWDSAGATDEGFSVMASFGDDAALGVYEIVEGFAIAVLGGVFFLKDRRFSN
jgi:hypothetical protein